MTLRERVDRAESILAQAALAVNGLPADDWSGFVRRIKAVKAERDGFVANLAECYRLTGADPDGNSDEMLAEYAAEEVRRLRAALDAAGEEPPRG